MMQKVLSKGNKMIIAQSRRMAANVHKPYNEVAWEVT
jgi:hypothetical protein